VIHECLPRLKVLDLSETYYTAAAWSSLQKLFPQLTQLNVTEAPLASGSSRDFFASIDEESLLKIIWIPQRWMISNRWAVSVPSDSIAKVEAAHKAFFAARKAKK